MCVATSIVSRAAVYSSDSSSVVQQACVTLCALGEEYLQLSTTVFVQQHRVCYGRFAIDVLEVRAFAYAAATQTLRTTL
jgi:hypothetical protein